MRKHKRLLGQEVETDDGLEWRVKWGQRGAGVSALIAVICYAAGQWTAANVFGALSLIFGHIVLQKRLVCYCKTIVARNQRGDDSRIGLCNWSIDITRPYNFISPMTGLLYVLLVSAFVFLDAVKVKSRVFVMVVGIIFVLVNINNIYHNILETGIRASCY